MDYTLVEWLHRSAVSVSTAGLFVRGAAGVAHASRARVTAWVAALVTVGWIVSVALSKQPLGFLAALR